MSDPLPSTAKNLPWILLGLMTVFSMAGPFVIFLIFKGGDHEGWPPDRPIEWWALGLITGLVVVLLSACVTVGIWSPRK